MLLTDPQRRIIQAFRAWIESAIETGSRFGGWERIDRQDESTLITRWAAGQDEFYEVAIRPGLPQVRVGLITEDRYKSRDFEQMIEGSGDTMQEFVALGFETAGLDWAQPPVEHYRQGQDYYFVTPVDLPSLDQLNDEAFRIKVHLIFEGYYHAFTGTARAPG